MDQVTAHMIHRSLLWLAFVGVLGFVRGLWIGWKGGEE